MINLDDPRLWSPRQVLENAPGLSLKEIGETVRWVGTKVGYPVGNFRWKFADIASWEGEQAESGSVVKLSGPLEELHFGTWEDALNFLTDNDNENAKRYYNTLEEMARMQEVEDDDEEFDDD